MQDSRPLDDRDDLPEEERRPFGRVALNIAAFCGYVLTALLFHWPLPARLGSALTGQVTGDTGVYVWNLWVFRHEIVEHQRFPLFTNEVLALSSSVDLSLHNYTLFADVLAFPLIPWLGITSTFNVIYLGLTVLTAWTTFLLARRLTGRTPESWLAGALFGFSPILVARSTAHFSLVAAAPLPVFVLALMRLERRPTATSAGLLGATMAWAAMCDVYFGVYCILIGASYLAVRWGRLIVSPRPAPLPSLVRLVDGLALATAVTIVFILSTGGTEIRWAGLRVGLRTLFTPVLALTLFLAIDLCLRWRPSFVIRCPFNRVTVIRCLAVSAATCVLFLSPVLYALQTRLADGGSLHGPIYWRSGPRGVDLMAFVTPNPANKLFGTPWRAWLTKQEGGYVENAAALTVVGLAVVGFAVWRHRFRPPRAWVAMLIFFGALALGPFVHVAGFNTYIPGPWAFLRYVPILSATRTPARFAIVAMLFFSVIFAMALSHITSRSEKHRRLLIGIIGMLLAFELAPFPRSVSAAHVPDIYKIIAKDPRDVRVLGIPFGISDGEGSEGRYNPSSQFYQTFHQKSIIGGGLSRISSNERKRQRSFPVLRVLLRMSEGRPVSPEDLAEARRVAPAFTRRARLGYVVIDGTASPELRNFAIGLFDLVKVGESDGRELFTPAPAPTDPLTTPIRTTPAAPTSP